MNLRFPNTNRSSIFHLFQAPIARDAPMTNGKPFKELETDFYSLAELWGFEH